MPIPVVLVHGFLAAPLLMTPLRRRMARHRIVVTPELSVLAVQDVRQLASQLDLCIDRARTMYKSDRVDVVGVSQGGIIALWWAHHMEGWSRLHKLVLVGAPVRGTWAAFVGLPLLGAVSSGIWQLLPSSPFVRHELLKPLPEGALVTTYSVQGDLVCPPKRCALPGATNLALRGPPGPWKHQWLGFSRSVAEGVRQTLESD
jgi:pimeloyl-ACP methyl ester carboxylesterase